MKEKDLQQELLKFVSDFSSTENDDVTNLDVFYERANSLLESVFEDEVKELFDYAVFNSYKSYEIREAIKNNNTVKFFYSLEGYSNNTEAIEFLNNNLDKLDSIKKIILDMYYEINATDVDKYVRDYVKGDNSVESYEYYVNLNTENRDEFIKKVIEKLMSYEKNHHAFRDVDDAYYEIKKYFNEVYEDFKEVDEETSNE